MKENPEKLKKGETPAADNDKNPSAKLQQRQIFMLILSLVVIGITLTASYHFGNDLFVIKAGAEIDSTTTGQTGIDSTATKHADSTNLCDKKICNLYPFFINLAGVLLFIMNTSRKKRGRWKLREYWGDHVFRIAQSFAYLFFILWAWPITSDNVASALPPIMLGFLVGMYILRVERAMEALGEKFGETLLTILPRSTQFISAEEKRRKNMRMVFKVDDIKTQYEVLRNQIDDPGARDKIDAMVAEAETAMEGEDPDKLKETIDKLTWTFDEAKKSAGEMLVPLEELLGERVLKDKMG